MTADSIAAPALPSGYTLRAARSSDLEAVFALMTACAVAESGEPYFALEDQRAEWRMPGFDLARDAWLVHADGDGTLAAYADANPAIYGDLDATGEVHVGGYACVDPAHTGRGLGTYLVWLAERRVRARMANLAPTARVAQRHWISTFNSAAQRIVERAGFAPVRRFWRMRIRLDETAPAPPIWPDGIAVRSMRPDEERAVHAAFLGAFAEHWGQTQVSFEDWQRRMIGREDFDSALWFIALDGERIAGFALCRAYPTMGWVEDLGVLPPWRGRGLGLALLCHSFAAFHRRGMQTVALGVDAANTTGATRLYERAGMSVYQAWDVYEKDLRPGLAGSRSGG